MPSLSGASIGTGVLPVWRDNPENARNFQREMFDKRQDFARMENEKKNWQVDMSKIDPVYRKDVMDKLAKLSSYVGDYLKTNPTGKGLIVDENYQRKLQDFQGYYNGVALPGSENIKLRQRVMFEHPDAHVVDNPDFEDALQTGDSERVRKYTNGSMVIRPETNLHPNIDVNKVVSDAKAFAKNQPTEDVKTYKPGYDQYIKTTTYDPDKGAQFLTNFQLSHPYAAHVPGLAERVAQSLATPDISTDIKPAPHYGSGDDEKNFTLASATPKTITIGSNVIGNQPYKDATGKTYAVVETKTDDKGKPYTVAKGTSTRVYPNKTTLEITTDEYYPLKGATVQTSSNFVIDGTTGMQKKVSGSKVYDMTGIGKFDYIIDKNGNAAVVTDSASSKIKNRSKIKTAYFADVLEDTGMKDGVRQYKPNLIKLNPDMIAAAKKVKMKLPDEVIAAATETGEVKQTTTVKTPNAEVKKTTEPIKAYTREELKAMSPSYTDEVIDAAAKAGKVQIKETTVKSTVPIKAEQKQAPGKPQRSPTTQQMNDASRAMSDMSEERFNQVVDLYEKLRKDPETTAAKLPINEWLMDLIGSLGYSDVKSIPDAQLKNILNQFK